MIRRVLGCVDPTRNDLDHAASLFQEAAKRADDGRLKMLRAEPVE